MTTRDKINSLKPGRSVELSSSNGVRVVAERSGDGKNVRLVRETRDGFTVILTQAF